MSLGGEIKVVLTLDDSGFSVKTKRAAEVAAQLQQTFSKKANSSEHAEKTLDALGKAFNRSADNLKKMDSTFAALNRNVENVANKLDRAASGFMETGKAASNFTGISDRAAKVMENGARASNTYVKAMREMAPELRANTRLQEQLAAAGTKLYRRTAASADQSAAAQLRAMRVERNANADLIADRERTVRRLIELEKELVSKQNAANAESKRYFGKNASRGLPFKEDAKQYGIEAEAVRQELAGVNDVVNALRRRNAELSQGIELTKSQAKAAREAADAKKKDEADAKKAEREAIAEKKKAAREQAQAERQALREKEQAEKAVARARAVEERQALREKEQAERKALREKEQAERKALRDKEREERESARNKDREEREAVRQRLVEERKALREKEQAERKALREKEQAERKALREKEQAERKALREKEQDERRAQREKEQADRRIAREQEREERATARRILEMKRRDASEAARAATEAHRAALRQRIVDERNAAREIADMWKGMAAMWASAKIDRGIGLGVEKASEAQQVDMRLRLLNLPAEEMEEFKKKAFDISQEEKYISTIDAMQARLDALTAIGYNNVKEIDETLQSAIRNAHILMASGYEKGTQSDLIKNFYGFAEARQVMNDPNKVRESFDIIRRSEVASGGKLNVGDFETVARHLGDMRATISADGWYGLASLMEQFKVAGSHSGGGGGAGVSSVGTIMKMMGLYASGKPISNVAAQQLLGADVLNVFDSDSSEAFKNATNYNRAFQKAIKTSGFKGVQEMSEDPIKFFSGLRGQILDFTRQDSEKSKFYENGQMDGVQAETTALKRFFAKMGLSNKTVDGLLTTMNPAFIERKDHVIDLAKNSMSEQEAIEKMRDTWAGSVSQMKAGAISLAAALSPLLEKLAVFPRVIGQVLHGAAAFAKENPMVAGFAATGIAIGSLILKLRAFQMMWGAFGSRAGGAAAKAAPGMLSTIGGALGTAAKAGGGLLGKAGGAIAGSIGGAVTTVVDSVKALGAVVGRVFGLIGSMAARLASAFTSVGVAIGRVVTRIVGMLAPIRAVGGGVAAIVRGIVGDIGAFGRAIGSVLKGFAGFLRLPQLFSLVGNAGSAMFDMLLKGALRFLPVIGWVLAAWDLTRLLLNFEVGGKKVSEWIVGWLESIKAWFALKWAEIKLVVLEALLSIADGSALAAITEWFNAMLTTLAEWAKSIYAMIADYFTEHYQMLVEFVESGIKWVTEKWNSLKEWVTSWSADVNTLFTKAFDPDTDILALGYEKIVSWGKGVADFMMNIADRIRGYLKSAIADVEADAAAARRYVEERQSQVAEGKNDSFWASFHSSANGADKKESKGDSKSTVTAPGGDKPNIRPSPTFGGGGGGGGRKKKAGGGGGGRQFEDPFAVKMAQYTGRGEIEKLKIDALTSENSTFAEQAKAEVMKMWLAGDLDVGKDPRKRKFVKAGVKYDPARGYGADDMDWNATQNIGGKQQGLKDLQAAVEEQLRLKAVLKGVAFAKERDNALTNESAETLRELRGETSGQTDAMKAITREFERMEARTPGLADNADYVREKARALTARAVLDYASEGIALKKKNADLAAEMDDDELRRTRAQAKAAYDEEVKLQRGIVEAHDKAIADMEAANETGTEQYKQALEARALAHDRFVQFEVLRARKLERDMRAPIERLRDEWRNAYQEIDQLAVNWSNSFLDNLATTLEGGKADWRSFVTSILKELHRIALKEAFGDGITGGFKKIGEGLKGLLSLGSPAGKKADDGTAEAMNSVTQAATSAATNLLSAGAAAGDMAGSAGKAIVKTIEGMTVESQAAFSLTAMSQAADMATMALVQMASSSGGGGDGGIWGTLLQGAIGAITGGTGGGDAGMFGTLGSSVNNSYASGMFNVVASANGNVMTKYGPLELKKYATGGIARKPQISLFGEAGPEAYVPLPDGRSIPVTMNAPDGGGVKQIVTINISVTNNGEGGKESQKSEGESSSDWTKLANRVKGVVREELLTQSRQGGILYK